MSPDSSQPRSPADAAPAPADTGKPAAAAAVPAEPRRPRPSAAPGRARGCAGRHAAAACRPAGRGAAPGRRGSAAGCRGGARARRQAGCAASSPSAAPCCVLFILWEIFTYFVAYTDDAYVRSDLVAVAPEVTGPIIAVHVVDNQTVKKGDKLLHDRSGAVPARRQPAPGADRRGRRRCSRWRRSSSPRAQGGPRRRRPRRTPMPSSSRRAMPSWRRATTRRAPSSTATTTSCAAPRPR